VFSFSFHLKKFGFWFIILQNETKHYARFLTKKKVSILHFRFWPQEAKKKKTKKPKSPHPPHEKFSILDGTKHTHENFGILHFIIPK
jgi:hypothetical protein